MLSRQRLSSKDYENSEKEKESAATKQRQRERKEGWKWTLQGMETAKG